MLLEALRDRQWRRPLFAVAVLGTSVGFAITVVPAAPDPTSRIDSVRGPDRG